jgi:hypothetical protein
MDIFSDELAKNLSPWPKMAFRLAVGSYCKTKRIMTIRVLGPAISYFNEINNK